MTGYNYVQLVTKKVPLHSCQLLCTAPVTHSFFNDLHLSVLLSHGCGYPSCVHPGFPFQ